MTLEEVSAAGAHLIALELVSRCSNEQTFCTDL